MNVITISIVLYNNSEYQLRDVINSIFHNKDFFKLYLIDNSSTDKLKNIAIDNRIEYIHNPVNPGFGAAHNIAISKAQEVGSKYHFIINPDIYFDTDVITPMINYIQVHSDIGMMMPQILYPDGSIQNLPKLLPNPLWMVGRKFKFPHHFYEKFTIKYELRDVPSEIIYNAPILSGCFTLLNLKAIKEIGTYDDGFFMYFEDWDLSRRMAEKYQTIYFPEVAIYHGYESGANKSFKLFKIFVHSAFHYFNKWGWFFDKKRKELNKQTLEQFK